MASWRPRCRYQPGTLWRRQGGGLLCSLGCIPCTVVLCTHSGGTSAEQVLGRLPGTSLSCWAKLGQSSRAFSNLDGDGAQHRFKIQHIQRGARGRGARGVGVRGALIHAVSLGPVLLAGRPMVTGSWRPASSASRLGSVPNPRQHSDTVQCCSLAGVSTHSCMPVQIRAAGCRTEMLQSCKLQSCSEAAAVLAGAGTHVIGGLADNAAD